MKRSFPAALAAVVFLCSVTFSLAAIKTFVREYTYEAGEFDSKATCRTIAMEQVKRQILEELGTYVESTTVVKDMQVNRDDIRTMTAGVVQTTVMDETWDGRAYWLKAQVKADPDEVAASIEKMRKDDQLMKDLEQSRLETSLAMDEIQQLKDKLAKAEGDNKQVQEQYTEAVNQIAAANLFEQGAAYSQAGNYDAAARSFNQAVILRPQDPKIYMNRSIAYIQAGNYENAARDLDRAASLNAAGAGIYISRAAAYKQAYEARRPAAAGRATPQTRPGRDIRGGSDPLQRVIDARRSRLNAEKRSPASPPELQRSEQVPSPGTAARFRQPHLPESPDARRQTSREQLRREREEARKTKLRDLKKKREDERADRRREMKRPERLKTDRPQIDVSGKERRGKEPTKPERPRIDRSRKERPQIDQTKPERPQIDRSRKERLQKEPAKPERPKIERDADRKDKPDRTDRTERKSRDQER